MTCIHISRCRSAGFLDFHARGARRAGAARRPDGAAAPRLLSRTGRYRHRRAAAAGARLARCPRRPRRGQGRAAAASGAARGGLYRRRRLFLRPAAAALQRRGGNRARPAHPPGSRPYAALGAEGRLLLCRQGEDRQSARAPLCRGPDDHSLRDRLSASQRHAILSLGTRRQWRDRRACCSPR